MNDRNFITLEELGYNPILEQHRKEHNLDAFEVGRVIAEHKNRYVVKNDQGEFDAELIGNLRFSAESRNDFPAVGDWVAISVYDEGKALIHAIYPRKSIIERQAVGKVGQKQIIATNVDCGLIVQAVDRDFNVNRLERYLTICHTAGIQPIIILSKIDLCDDLELNDRLENLTKRLRETTIIPLSNESKQGIDELKTFITAGQTFCLLGSSGVGKSTLLNNLSEKELMKTAEISESANRGKHVTTHRELLVLPNGGILIDNPGMREVGITGGAIGLETTFDEMAELADQCKFRDCTHINEIGCAILEALEAEEIDQDAYNNYQKMKREQAHFDRTVADKRRREKSFGKMVKDMKKSKKGGKY